MSVSIVRTPLPPLPPDLAHWFATRRFSGGAWTDCHCSCGWMWRAFDAKGQTSRVAVAPFVPLTVHVAVKHGGED